MPVPRTGGAYLTARRVRELLAEIIATEDSTDDAASDYTLTVAFHPTPRPATER